MPDRNFVAYVITHNGHYCKFGSYSSFRHVASPLAATIYMDKRNAVKRATETGYFKSQTAIPAPELKLEAIQLFLVKQTQISKA